jgi:hypothetical protein
MFDFEIYWDDSGTHDGSPIAVAACYIASREQWGRFVRDWDEARLREGFDDFHMKNFMSPPERGKEPFCHWDKRKKNRVYSWLASIINTRVRHGFAFAVPTESFEMYATEKIKKEITPDAFIFAVQMAFGMLAEWYAKYGEGKAIQYVFEDRKGMGKVKQIWDTMKDHPDVARGIGMRTDIPDGFSFQSPKLFKPLQAADMLAWNMNAHMRDVILKGFPDDDSHCRPYFRSLRAERPMRLGYLTETQMRQSFEDLNTIESENGGKSPYLLPRYLRKLYHATTVDQSEFLKIRERFRR